MITAKTPIVSRKNPDRKENHNFFIVSENIIPVRRYSHDSIPSLQEEITEKVVPYSTINSIVKRYKNSNSFYKFFERINKYLDNAQNFLDTLTNLFYLSNKAKKVSFYSEKSDQLLKSYQAKKLLKQTKETKAKPTVDLNQNPNVAALLAAALGISVAKEIFAPPGSTEIYDDVAGEGEFQIQETTTQSPAWIPFPKGTSGLVFTSGYKWRWGRQHKGIDIAGSPGTPIITPITGVVSEAGFDSGGYGYKVVIKSNQVSMLFGHLLQQPPVRSGQNVAAGTVIGLMGSTGRSTGPHLHWEVILNGMHVDPSAWTRSNKPSISTAGANVDLKDSEPPNHPSKQSDGGFDINRRILVGEAGLEFVVPLSEMPLFAHGMMEEKIKTLIPSYQSSMISNIGIKKSYGIPTSSFSEGKIVINYSNPNYSIAAKKLKQLFPMAKNHHIAAAMGNFEIEAPGLIPTTQQAGGPGYGIAQWTKTQRWGGQDSPLYYSALKFGGPGIATSLTKQLEFVKFELTDPRAADNITGGHQKPSPLQKWLVTRDVESATETFMNVYEQPGEPHWSKRLAAARDFYKNMDKLLGTAPKKPKKAAQEKESLWDKFKNLFAPAKKKASINEIDGGEQMQISKSYSNEFDYQKLNNEIVALYKPTVYYSET